MLLATIDWRESFGVDDVSAASVRRNGETGKVFVCGPDTSGQPVLLMRPGACKGKGCASEFNLTLGAAEVVVSGDAA